MKALGERWYSSYSFFTSALHWGEWSASRSGRALPPGKRPPLLIVLNASMQGKIHFLCNCAMTVKISVTCTRYIVTLYGFDSSVTVLRFKREIIGYIPGGGGLLAFAEASLQGKHTQNGSNGNIHNEL
jgi:hypothetical protein